MSARTPGATDTTGAASTVGAGPGALPEHLPPEGRAALRAGVVGNWIDNIHVFLPLVALSPALEEVAGPTAGASAGALVVIAMLLGRPVGGVVLGGVADRLGRTRTTRLAIAGTAGCSLAIACMPTHKVLGTAALVLIVLLRLAGGVLVAGEYSAAIPLAMEWSTPRRRGLMSGLWLLTSATVLVLTARLASDAGLPTRTVGLVMGVASLAQAVAMVGAGHLSTLVGRRRILIAWGLVAAAVAPWVWRAVLGAPDAGRAAPLAALLQVITVAAYGPVAAYLSERFPVRVRSTGYGSVYSLSLVVPALYPFYLPLLEPLAGRTGAVLVLVACGGALVAVGAALGPALGPDAAIRELDDVAGGGR